jgi:hypothetical protein
LRPLGAIACCRKKGVLFEKRTKNFLLMMAVFEASILWVKVFCFFFSKKKRLPERRRARHIDTWEPPSATRRNFFCISLDLSIRVA